MSTETRRDVLLEATRLAADGATVAEAIDRAAPNVVLRVASEAWLSDYLRVKSLSRWDSHRSRTQGQRVAALAEAAEALRYIE